MGGRGGLVGGFLGGFRAEQGRGMYLGQAFLVLASVQRGPGDPSGVLALEEEGFRFAVLETEDFAVAADVEFALPIAHMS